MPVRTANAEWKGGLKDGAGTFGVGSGAVSGAYSFGTRFEEVHGTNPEELVGAAHASCFSMALSAGLGKAGFPPKRVATTAKVHLGLGEGGFQITKIELDCVADVPGIDAATFAETAEASKRGCPISKALAAVEIALTARLA
jgi:lipoyl-dependent peroxiredoxin